MSQPAKSKISPAAILLAIRTNMARRPLWKLRSVMDLCGLSRDQVLARIEDGTYPYAFDIRAAGSRCKEARVFSYSVVEQHLGPHPNIGATRNLKLSEVINLIFPARDIRSTELKRIFSCDEKHVHRALKPALKITKKAAAADGPFSYCVISRSSVAAFLEKRRMT